METLGIDIGGSRVKTAVVADGEVVFTAQSEKYTKPDRARIILAIREALGRLGSSFERVGVCCPGLFDRTSNSISLSVNLPGLVGVPMDSLVYEAVSVAGAVFISDANAVAFDLYETRHLTGRLLCLSLGTGVGAGVVDDGNFLHVSGESPGHFGQMDVSLIDQPPIGPDGGAGSLEAYIGGAALEGLDVAQMTVADPPIRALVRALRIAHAIYRPAHIALAGGVGIRLSSLTPAIREAVQHRLTSVTREGWTLFTGVNQYHAAAGVARWAAKLHQLVFNVTDELAPKFPGTRAGANLRLNMSHDL